MTAADAIPLRRAPTDLVALLTGTIETLQEQASALDVTLAIDAEPSLPRMNVDAEKIAWAVATLVGNAFRYVRRGTRRLPGGAIHVHLRTEDGFVVVAVDDDGPGIPADKVANLFRRGHGVTHGTGLALMLIEDVVAAHGGTIEVKSKCDAFASGTTITLRLPTSAGDRAAPPG
ncbi:MAG: sensor histidine kinase [Polyangiaceae bacterium]|jgi:signal transduction histidine kinase